MIFFLGDNIRHEFELQDQISKDREIFISETLNLIRKYGITAGKSPLIELFCKKNLADFLKDCANNKSKGNHYTNDDLIKLLSSLKEYNIPNFDQDKLNFIQTDLVKKESIIKQLESLEDITISPNNHVCEIEENTEAIGILNRFHKSKCIVCDNENIDWEALLREKIHNRETTLGALEERIRNIIETIIPLVNNSDQFKIKECILNAIENGNKRFITTLLAELKEYENLFCQLIENEIVHFKNVSNLISHYCEYQQIIEKKPDISDEDYLFIQEIISNSMSKPLKIDRDENKRLRIYLSDQEFLGKKREDLPLSTGEQNFLSLTFEFLKAKNTESPIVVIDDPVSSFDSIYKNKVVYAIVKILHHKKRIVLTHNTDLIRLLDGQYKHCFKLYLLNNTEGEVNGFIPLNNQEQEMLISLEKLLEAFRSSVPNNVISPELFLISMIPFMRGYANVICNKSLFDSLTQVMHGYKTEKVDIAKAYQDLFKILPKGAPDHYEISVPDIIQKHVDGIHLLNIEKFPLLDKTLRHSFVYLFLRLIVEKRLVEKFKIDTAQNEQLGQIISAAYPDENDIEQIRNRIRLTSKKTLINDFNHFEGNLSIFQPAIDITDQALGKEKTDIITFINSL